MPLIIIAAIAGASLIAIDAKSIHDRHEQTEFKNVDVRTFAAEASFPPAEKAPMEPIELTPIIPCDSDNCGKAPR